ncbi:MAG: hypothetical protein DRJ13_14765 [Bacteroidetes bacterium]|nr:MAG: hypothetical protein DRJ13_14765 [Bacteroidota bacterium]
MKFDWGTGILIFLILFLLAAAAFMVFAFKQDVNLVYKDYYNKGVDYTEQMDVIARSENYYSALQTRLENEFLVLDFEESLALKIDSGSVLMYRPSDSKQDLIFPLDLWENRVIIPKDQLISGRYILKLFWYSEGLKYEVDKQVNIQ